MSTWYMYIIINIMIIIVMHLTPMPFFFLHQSLSQTLKQCRSSVSSVIILLRVTIPWTELHRLYTDRCQLYIIILLVKKEERKMLRTYRHSRVENGSHGRKSSVPLCHGLLQGTEPLQRLTHYSHLQDEPMHWVTSTVLKNCPDLNYNI